MPTRQALLMLIVAATGAIGVWANNRWIRSRKSTKDGRRLETVRPIPAAAAYVAVFAWVCALGALAAAADQPQRVAASTEVLARWLQILPDGPGGIKYLARAIVPAGADCPALRKDSLEASPLKMEERHNPYPGAFPVAVCEAIIHATPEEELPRRVYFPDLGYLRLAPVKEQAIEVNRVAFIGDTGCRGLRGKQSERQACDDEAQWPLRRMAAAMAKVIESGSADLPLLVHVGDYTYRDEDSWLVWRDEFFAPMRPLLDTAPWIMARGNHESCTFRNHPGADGWFLFFGFDGTTPAQTQTCPIKDLSTYTLAIKDGPRLIVFDTADAYPGEDPPAPVGSINRRADELAKSIGKVVDALKPSAAGDVAQKESWLVSHVPLIGRELKNSTANETDETKVVWRALGDSMLSSLRITRAISGDRHFFQLACHSDAPKLLQIVADNGGVYLDAIPPHNLKPAEPERTAWLSYRGFGFVEARAKLGADGKPVLEGGTKVWEWRRYLWRPVLSDAPASPEAKFSWRSIDDLQRTLTCEKKGAG